MATTIIKSPRFFDTWDTKNYLQAVEELDGQPLENMVWDAVHSFIVGCKSDGNWDAIKACCILSGARTLEGALVPLKGTAPTNYNFVQEDYDRKTGLKGNAGNKYLDTNRANNADPRDSNHNAAFVTEPPTTGITLLGTASDANNAQNVIMLSGLGTAFDVRSRSGATTGYMNRTEFTPGIYGMSRYTSFFLDVRAFGENGGAGISAQTPSDIPLHVFRRSFNANLSNPRIAFYSIGESINLELLDNRVSELIDAFSNLP